MDIRECLPPGGSLYQTVLCVTHTTGTFRVMITLEQGEAQRQGVGYCVLTQLLLPVKFGIFTKIAILLVSFPHVVKMTKVLEYSYSF